MFLISFTFYNCQDVIDVDLNTDNPRLVIDASINWLKRTPGEIQKIKLTTTTNYYTKIIPIVTGAVVSIKNSDGLIYNFTEKPNSGEYICTNFTPVLSEEYKLTIIANGQIYEASENLIRVSEITKLEQNTQPGFGGKEVTQFKAFFVDPPNIDNYYLYKYIYSTDFLPNYNVTEDTFFQGNQIFSSDFKTDLKIGDKLQVSHYGISKKYYNYLNILLTVAGNSGGGPFQSPPATVRGNIVNLTNVENYPLGYFSLSEQSNSEIYSFK